MAERYGMFDSTPDDPREYSMEEFSRFFTMFLTSGIFNGGTNLKVFCDGTNINTRIDLGRGWIQGYCYEVYDNPIVLQHDLPDINLDRIDRVILRLDKTLEHRYLRAFIKKGTPASNPAPPQLTRNDNVWEISLAQVKIIKGKSYIEGWQITDERLNNDVCGLVNSLIQADTKTIFDQFQYWYNSKTKEYETNWGNWYNTKTKEYTDKTTEIINAWNTWFNNKTTEFLKTWNDWYGAKTPALEKQFTNWFNAIKSKLDGDIATSLQNQIDSLSAEITTEKMAIEHIEGLGVVDLPNIEDGYINIDKIEGNTLVNINKSYWDFTANPAGIMTKSNIEGGIRVNRSKSDTLNWATVLMGKFIGLLKEDTTYSFIFEAKVPSSFHAAAVIQDEDGKNMLSSVANFTMFTGINIVPIKTFKFDKVQPLNQVLGLGVAAAPLGNFDITNLMVLEGDWTNKPIPLYFEGLKNVKDIKVKSIYKNWANFTKPVSFKAEGLGESEMFPLTFLEPIFSMALYNEGSLIPADINIHISFYDENKKYIDSWSLWENPRPNMNTTQLGYGSRIRYGKISAQKDLTKDVTITGLMINGGAKNLPFEPYKESVTNTSLTDEKSLKRLPNGVRDMYHANGIVNRKIKSKIITENDIDSIATNYSELDYAYLTGDFIKDFFPETTNHGYKRIIIDGKIGTANLSESITPYVNRGFGYSQYNKAIFFSYTKGVTLEQFKQDVVGRTVYYELAEPTTEPTTEQLDILKPLRCFKGGHLIIESDIPVPLTFRYPTNFGSRVQSAEEALGKVIQEQQELDNKISNIKVPVTSVNNKTGAVVLNSNDIKTNDGSTVEEEINNLQSQINSTAKYFNTVTSSLDGRIGDVNNKADDISKRTTTAQSTADAAKKRADEAFQFANDGKTKITNVVGSPLLASDTFQQQSDKIQTLKNTLATNLNSKGQSSNGNENLNSLISKIANINLNKRYATGEGTMPLNISNLSFKPRVVLIFSRIDWYILADLPIGTSVAYPLDGKKIWEIGDCNPSRTIEASLNANGFIASENSINNRIAAWYAWE